VAVDDRYSVEEDDTLRVSAYKGVLANDSDPDGDQLTATKLTNPSRGRLTFNSDGSFRYSPPDDFEGTVSFTYQVSDGNGGTATATVIIEIED